MRWLEPFKLHSGAAAGFRPGNPRGSNGILNRRRAGIWWPGSGGFFAEVKTLGLFAGKEKFACNCGMSFDSKEELQAHAKKEHKM